MCGYFLNATSETPILMSGYLYNPNNSTKGEALIMRALPLTTLFTRERLFNSGSLHFKDLRDTIADVLLVSATNGSAETVYQDAPPVANECVLSWCVQTLRSSYDSGMYHEEVVHTVYNTTAGPSPWIAIPYQTEFENGTDIFYIGDINIGIDHFGDGHNTTQYGTSNETASSIIQGFVDIFPAFSTASNESAKPTMRYKTWSGGPPWIRLLEFNPWLAPNNVTRHMERLATAMTNVIRSVEGNTEIVLGSSYGREVFIRVRWEWLTFPLLLLVLSLVFLISTIVKTSKDVETGIWKTSAMPTLIYSLPKDTQQAYASQSLWKNNADQKIKKIKIRLLPNQGWRVSGQTCTSPTRAAGSDREEPPGWI
jgi:hypothetical protein